MKHSLLRRLCVVIITCLCCLNGVSFRVFHFLLQLAELLEYILIVQQSMRELLFEEISLQVILNALFYTRDFQKTCDRGPLCRVFLQTNLHDVFERE